MFVEKSLPWGEIRGKLSLSPEQAEEMLGYKMKPGAKGVVFQVRNGRQVVLSLMPNKPKFMKVSKKMKAIRTKVGTLGTMVGEHKKTLVMPIWHKEARKNKYFSGAQFFTSVNLRRLGYYPIDWMKLRISTGDIKKPEFGVEYCPGRNIVVLNFSENTAKRLKSETLEPKVAIFYTNHLKLYHPMERYNCVGASYIKLPVKLKGHWEKKIPIVLMYLKQGNRYSESSSRELKRCKNYDGICNVPSINKNCCPYFKGEE
ncbi:MAG: hypothetical protein PHE49_02030 [bacterium]|nr:hypothetical protein [bacterium]